MKFLLAAILSLAAVASLTAAELPPPDRLVVHPDGLSATWRLPPEATPITLPEAFALDVLAGADWREERLFVPATPAPAWEERIAERQALRLEWTDWRARSAALDRYRQLLETALDRQAPPAEGGTDSWQQAIDALLRATQDRDERAADLRQRGRTLLSAIEEDTWSATQLLGLHPDGSADPDWRAATGRRRLASGHHTRLLHLLPHGEGPIVLAARLAGGWRIENELSIVGDTAHWRRLARIHLEEDWPWAAVSTSVDEEELRQRLDEVAAVPSVSINSQEVGWRLGRRIDERQVRVDLPHTTSADAGAGSLAPRHLPAFSASQRAAPISAPRRWEVGVLRPDHAGLVVELEQEQVAVTGTHWEIAPEQHPVAYRHLRLAGAEHTIPAGHLRILWQGKPVADGFFHGAAAGEALSLRAGSDPSLTATPPQAWPLDPEHDPQRRQRQGAWSRLCNAGDQARQLRVVVARPVSDSDELQIEPDPATSPDGTALGDGLHSWTIDLAPGACQRLDWGCQISTRGRISLPVPDHRDDR